MKSLRYLVLLTGLCSGLPHLSMGAEESPAGAVPVRRSLHWRTWGAAAFESARQTGKPVYVFAGSRLSELSRATFRLSFEAPETVEYFEDHFICVQVDLEEAPGLGALLRNLAGVVRQADGVPLHFWFSPEQRLLEVSGYQPAHEEWGKPGLHKLAMQVGELWAADPAGCGSKIAETLALTEGGGQAGEPAAPEPKALEEAIARACARVMETADHANLGFGEAPKQVAPELLRFLDRRGGAEAAFARASLRRIACSALRDPLDGGLFHYSTDASWRLPSLQKLAGDQARFALACLELDARGRDEVLREAGVGALDYALSHLLTRDGDFVHAEDGTVEGCGTHYQWRQAELVQALGDGAGAFLALHKAGEAGNLGEEQDPGHRYAGVNFLVSSLPVAAGQREAELKVEALRSQRPRPMLDARRFLGGNALLLEALSEAAGRTGEKRYREAADRLFQRLLAYRTSGDATAFVHQFGATEPASPADRAQLVLGLQAYGRLAGETCGAGRLALQVRARLLSECLDSGRHGLILRPLEGGTGACARRVPAPQDPLHPAALLLLSGLDGPEREILQTGVLADLIGGEEPPAGELLLGLAATSAP